MPRYQYKAHDQGERILTGTTDGGSIDQVIEQLEGRRLIPITIEELNFDGSRKRQSVFEKLNDWVVGLQNRVPYKTVVFFTRQLATMLSGGVPLTRALEQLARSEDPVFKKIINSIAEDISIGHSFSDAIARHSGAFDNMYVSVVRSGEVTGALDNVLEQMATYMENVETLKAKVRAAMRYPIFIGIFVFALVTVILLFLVPQFETIYSSFGAKLPAPTLMLIAVSNMIRNRFLWVVGAVVASVAGFNVAMTRERFSYFVHKHMFRLPVFGGILRKNILATFCRTMALLMNSGTPILQAIEIAAAVVNNKMYARSLENVYSDLRQGDLLSTALERTGEFPVLVTQLVSTGEESGRVDELLCKAAEFYEREIRNVVDSLAAIIEPVLIIFLGGFVGAILIALYLPVFHVGKLIGGN
jgi:type IV pilus assembly protein PilC